MGTGNSELLKEVKLYEKGRLTLKLLKELLRSLPPKIVGREHQPASWGSSQPIAGFGKSKKNNES